MVRSRYGIVLTINAVVDTDRMKRFAAYGTCVGLLSPGTDAGIVYDMFASIQSGDDVKIANIVVNRANGDSCSRICCGTR